MNNNIRTEKEITKNWKESEKPLASVACITFNHEKYVKEAIESLLMQETDFAFEIIIHDDSSTDKTADIIRRYAAQYPKLIKPILQTVNQHSQNIEILSTCILPEAEGKYIAICEGDDYWIDPGKLQIQVDFLEKNITYSSIAHQTLKIIEGDLTSREFFSLNVPEILHLHDLLDGRRFHTASLMFRAEITKKHKLPNNIIAVDRALNFLVAAHGPIKYLDTAMCVYRKNEGGISSRVTPAMMKKDFNMIPWICNIIPSFPKYRYKSFIHKTIFTYPQNISIKELVAQYFLFVLYSLSFFPKNIKPVMSITIKFLPRKLFNFLKWKK